MKSYLKKIKLLAGPLLAIFIYIVLHNNKFSELFSRSCALIFWMAFWWITEAVSIYITGIIPLVFFPLLGVMNMDTVTSQYAKEIIFLFVGSFMFAYGMEKWNLHKRIALKIILTVGSSPWRIVLGFILSSWFLSMWILNTAAVSILMPAAIAVISHIENETKEKSKISIPLLLGIAYASSIGGMATLIGTAPNIVLVGNYNNAYPNEPITFMSWMLWGMPVSIFLLIALLIFFKSYFRSEFKESSLSMEYCRDQYLQLGKRKPEENIIIILLFFSLILFATKDGVTIGGMQLKGWSIFFENKKFVTESTIMMFIAFLLFIIPSKTDTGENILSWNEAKKVPLGIIFLFGGGFALAELVQTSGIALWLSSNLNGLENIHPVLIIFVLTTSMIFFTEFTSNTASALLVIPILLSIAPNIQVNALAYLIPVTLAASCAFMMPVATPPNTIVFGSEKIKITEMLKTGFLVNIISVIIITLAGILLSLLLNL